jgi:hypothetical protein
VKVDGYSVDVPQPNARRVPDDHEGDVPPDCQPTGISECRAGHPSLLCNEKDMVDHGERAIKLFRALQAAKEGLLQLPSHCLCSPQ